MSRLWPLVRREYLERVRSRAFLIGTVLGPVLVAALMIVPALIIARQTGEPLRVAVLDESGALGEPVEEALAGQKIDGQARFRVVHESKGESRLREAVLAGRLDGYLRLPKDALQRSVAEYHGRNVSNVMDLRLMDRAVEQTMVAMRLAEAGVDPARLENLTRRLDLKTIRLSASGSREDRGAATLVSIVLMMMLYTTVIMWGQALMTGVIEEKSNRVVEVMVSAVPSVHLLAAKLLGVGAAGLTQFLVWSLSIAAISTAGAGMAAASGAALPEVSGLVLASFVVYFLLGYFLYAALFAAVGASVNTTHEAQSLVFPIFTPLVVGVMFFPLVLQSPDGRLSTVLSLIPFLTPLLMFLRITVLTPDAWQIALSVALTLLTIAGVVWVSARIYRVGILMYGKRPSLREILRWVRHS